MLSTSRAAMPKQRRSGGSVKSKGTNLSYDALAWEIDWAKGLMKAQVSITFTPFFQFRMPSENPFSIAVVVPSRGRLVHLQARIPLWVKSGFDEVVVVDGSYSLATRRRTEELCKLYGAKYVPGPRTLRDTRSLQRNLGARGASTEWVYFQDDDDAVVMRIKRPVLERAAEGVDWLVGPKGQHIMMQRRATFLSFGGYPEDMVAAEDMIMSNRARAFGKGGVVWDWFEEEVLPTTPVDDPLSRARNAFWYGATMFLFILRTQDRKSVVIGDFRRLAIFGRNVLRRELRSLVYLLCAMAGRAVSPLHAALVVARKGRAAVAREERAGWAGLR